MGAVIAGRGSSPDDRALEWIGRLAKKKNPALFVSLLGKTIERHVKVDATVRERVRLINLTGLDLSDPDVRKRLGPSILGELPTETTE